MAVLVYPGAKWKAWAQIHPLIPNNIEDWREPFFGGGSVTLSYMMASDKFSAKQLVVGDLASEIWAFWQGCKEDTDGVIKRVHGLFYEKCPTHDLVRAKASQLMINKDIELRNSSFEPVDTFTSQIEMLLKLDTSFMSQFEKSDIEMQLNRLYSLKASYDEYLEMYLKATKEAEELWAWAQSNEVWDWKADNADRLKRYSLTDRAARTFITNRISFSGMGDSGSLSRDRFMGFTVGQTQNIKEVESRLKKLTILNAPFQTTMKDVDKDKSFVFLDPPYIAQEGSGLYGRGGDTHKGFPHLELADLCKSLPCKWLMTLDDSIQARTLYSDKHIEIKPFYIPYTMAKSAAEDALNGEEIFIANYDINEENSFDDMSMF